MFDLGTDSWSKALPSLNLGRFNHSSCALGSKVFVVGGETVDADGALCEQVIHDSVEVLDIEAEGSAWQVIRSHKLAPRVQPAVSAISADEVVIMGGSMRSDIIIFQASRGKFKVILEDCKESFVCLS